MQVDQFVRRMAWRTRRRIRGGADNEPIVELATPAPAPKRARGRGWFGVSLTLAAAGLMAIGWVVLAGPR